MPQSRSGVRTPLSIPILRRAAAVIALIALAPTSSASQGGPGPHEKLRLGLVESEPAPGIEPVQLDQAVTQIRARYGRSTLVRLTHQQEQSLRSAGYQVRVFEDPERVGIGYYAFRVPPGPVNLPPDLTVDESRSGRATFLVKLIGPPQEEWLAGIRALGGEILTPIPEFTYLVRAAPRQHNRVAALPYVEWVGPYHPAYKLNEELAHGARTGKLPQEPAKLNVLIYRSGDVEGAINRIRGMKGELLNRSTFDFYELVVVRIPPALAPDLARLADVYIVEPVRDPELEDESSTQILAGQIGPGNIPFRPIFGEPTYTDWLTARTLDGSDVTIGYADDGLINADPTDHLDGRVTEGVCGTVGADGHAMFGASDAGGVCPHTPEAASGFLYGLGVAPGVNFINIPFLKSTGACNHDDSQRARDTVITNGPNGVPGTIQNNSWGAGRGDNFYDGTYTSAERTFDILTRDANSLAAGNQQLITCFSAGNDGNATLGSGGDSPATLTRPHVAKNILTTGSSSVYRPSAGASNINDRSPFSSQGPTFDGRVKPDFMAPGGAGNNNAAISGAAVGAGGCAVTLDAFHCLSAGTSFSSPQTAGGAALLVQWWKRFAPATPSPALVKALLVNSSRDLQGGNTNDLIPNRHEGWGRWNLGNLLEPGTPTVVADGPIFKKTSGLGAVYLDQSVVFTNNGDQYQLRLVPSNPAVPLRATLVWTDAPGAVNSCPSLVNDLDLELVQNGTDLLRGNAITDGLTVAGGPADSRNNVEQVIQPTPSGFYTLTVRAAALAGDGIPASGDATDQDFALVVTNAVPYTGPILAAGTIAPADACAGTGSGNNSVIDPGETLTFPVPLVNSGNAAATSVSGNLTTSTPGVTVVDGSSAYPNIPAGSTASPTGSDTLSVALADTVPCGSGVDLTLNVSTAQGSFAVPIHFDVGSKTVSTQDLPGSTGPVGDDIANPTDFTTLDASPGTIRSVSVDVDIPSVDELYLFNNFSVQLMSPAFTSVLLHSNPIPCSTLVANYPNNRLAQEGTLETFEGENGGGVWTLRVSDRNNVICSGGGPPRPCSEASVSSWTLHLTTESPAACNTCLGGAPPEVSAPGSPTPVTMSFDDVAGTATFGWENLGSQADSYRLYQGSIASLAGTGVTSSNTAPIQCGITTPGTTLTPAAGDLFYLVAAQKGALVGPLGQATEPATFPRSANQTCP